MKIIVLILLFLFSFCILVAQENTWETTSSFTSSSSETGILPGPWAQNWSSSVVDYIITASEMQGSGIINGIKLHYSFPRQISSNLYVYLCNTTSNSEYLWNSWLDTNQLTMVFAGVVQFLAESNTVTLMFSQPFQYTGSNLAIRIHRSNDYVYSDQGLFFDCNLNNNNRHIIWEGDLDVYQLPSDNYSFGGAPTTTFIMTPYYNIPTIYQNYESIDYQRLRLGDTRTETILIRNISSTNMVLSDIDIQGSTFFSVQNTPIYPDSLNCGEIMQFEIVYSPTEPGSHNGTFILVFNGNIEFCIPVLGECSDVVISTLPYIQLFDSAPQPLLPNECFGSVISVGGYNSVNGVGGPFGGYNGMIVFPPLSDDIDIDSLHLTFMAIGYYYWVPSNPNGRLYIGFVDDYDINSFETVFTTGTSGIWEPYYFNLSSYSGSNRSLAIKFSWGLGGHYNYMVIDNLVLSIGEVQIVNPEQGDLFAAGTTELVQWNTYGCPMDLSISFDGGSNWSLIGNNLGGVSGLYSYSVPQINAPQCKIKVSSQRYPQLASESDMFSITTNSNMPKISITYPNSAGIHFYPGQEVNITWIKTNTDSVDIEISPDNCNTWVTVASGIGTDFFTMLVPDIPSTDCRIRVKSSSNQSIADISDNAFTISKVLVLTPNMGGIFTSDYSNGYSTNITWEAEGMSFVRIEYSLNGGANWTSIVNSYPAPYGSYVWQLPGTPSSNCRIRVCNAALTSINSVSESFTLRNPIKLTNANGGGFITNGSLFTIKWQNQDVNPEWSVWWEYSLNNSTWTRIYTNATAINAQQLAWFVTSGLASSVWLRAVETSGNRIIGKSEGPFVVTDKSLILWSPTGGEEYNALSTQNISWEAVGCSNLNISLSTDDGVSWTNVATSIPSSQLSYQWLVPDTPSVNCRIKLTDTSYTFMNLMCDLPFTIAPLQVIAPTVEFSADNLSGDIPLNVQFTEEVNPGVGNIASRLWDFGDGNTSDQTNPLHIYSVAGTYTVSLTVTNDFDGSTTESKTDYITALPNTPRIELMSATSFNYGVVYLGDTSPVQTIEVKNVGTAPMHITSVSYYLANSQFALLGTELPITVPVNESTQINVVFVPITNGAVSDSIYIHSDASNLPNLAVKLYAVGEYVPPAAVEGLEVSVIGDDAHLSWLPVTTTIYDTPIDPDGYIVLYNETPYEDEHFYYFLTFVTGTNFVHTFVAQYRQQMFYRIVAVKNYREAEIAYLMSLNESRDRLTWGAVMDKLHTLKQRQ